MQDSSLERCEERQHPENMTPGSLVAEEGVDPGRSEEPAAGWSDARDETTGEEVAEPVATGASDDETAEVVAPEMDETTDEPAGEEVAEPASGDDPATPSPDDDTEELKASETEETTEEDQKSSVDEQEISRLQMIVLRQNDELHDAREKIEELQSKIETPEEKLAARAAHEEELLGFPGGSPRWQINVRELQEALGMPRSSESQPQDADKAEDSEPFFPPLLPLVPEIDVPPVVLCGDSHTFHMTNLFIFLETSHVTGMLTIVNGEFTTKLYMENSTLRLVAWDQRDPVFSLPGLLIESELLTEEALAPYVEERLYDYDIACHLLAEKKLEARTLRACLREHTRVIVSELFQVGLGVFTFQPGKLQCENELMFDLSITDLLLRTAAHVDEKSRSSPELEALED